MAPSQNTRQQSDWKNTDLAAVQAEAAQQEGTPNDDEEMDMPLEANLIGNDEEHSPGVAITRGSGMLTSRASDQPKEQYQTYGVHYNGAEGYGTEFLKALIKAYEYHHLSKNPQKSQESQAQALV